MKKRFYLIFALAFFMLACSDGNDVYTELVDEYDGCVKLRSEQDVLDIATDAASMFKEDSRSTERVVDGEIIAIKSSVSRSGENDTLIYIVNYADEQGFAIISAPENVEPLLGVAEEGSFSDDVMSVDDGFTFFMDMAKEFVSESLTDNDNSYYDMILENIVSGIEPKVSVRWGQVWPEGIYCSNGMSGCGPTAIAQILTYYEKPSSIALTYDGADVQILPLNWNNIKKHKQSYYEPTQNDRCGLTGMLETHMTIGRLCRQIGELGNCTYYYDVDPGTDLYWQKNATSIGRAGSYNALKELLPDNTIGPWKTYECERFAQDIQRGPCYVAGSGSSSFGHAWVADGYQKRRYNVRKCIGEGDNKRCLTEIVDRMYFHYNWGRNGRCNGFFYDGVFNTMPDSEFPYPFGWYDDGVIVDVPLEYNYVIYLSTN